MAAIRCRNIYKRFGRVQALDGVSLEVHSGRLHAVVGENGAGKSTLMRVIAGELNADHGYREVSQSVGLVRQNLSLVPGLTVLENIIFGAEPLHRRRIDFRSARQEINALMRRVQLPVELDTEAVRLPVSMQQRVEILRVLFQKAQILIFDEPTALLTPLEAAGLFRMLHFLLDEGHTVVYISHKLPEIVAHCAAITVLRHGKTVAQFDQAPFDIHSIAHAMVGKLAADSTLQPRSTPAQPEPDTPVVLRACLDQPHPLVVHTHQIVGIAGIAGNGQEDLVKHLLGIEAHAAFSPAEFLGVNLQGLTTIQRRQRGLQAIPGNVRKEGCALSASLHDNFLTTEPPKHFVLALGRLQRSKTRLFAQDLIADNRIVTTGPEQLAQELSGGNLQRMVVARELAGSARLVVAHEPTRGVDFNAATQIRARLLGFAQAGGAVLLISSDLDELLQLCDSIYVLHAFRLVAQLSGTAITRSRLGELLGGISEGAAS